MSIPDPLSDFPFDYRVTKDDKIFITWRGKQARILTGAKAAKFLAEVKAVDEAEAQLLMARITGNFKRGNERTASDHNR